MLASPNASVLMNLKCLEIPQRGFFCCFKTSTPGKRAPCFGLSMWYFASRYPPTCCRLRLCVFPNRSHKYPQIYRNSSFPALQRRYDDVCVLKFEFRTLTPKTDTTLLVTGQCLTNLVRRMSDGTIDGADASPLIYIAVILFRNNKRNSKVCFWLDEPFSLYWPSRF